VRERERDRHEIIERMTDRLSGYHSFFLSRCAYMSKCVCIYVPLSSSEIVYLCVYVCVYVCFCHCVYLSVSVTMCVRLSDLLRHRILSTSLPNAL
jgi:hypothetical protein